MIRVDLLPEETKLLLSGRLVDPDLVRNDEFESGVLLDLLHGHTGLNLQELHTLGLVVVAQNGQVRNHAIRACARGKPSPLPGARAVQVPRRGQEVHLGHEAALGVPHDGDGLPAQRPDVVRPATARKPYLGPIVVPDDRGVQVAVRVYLRPAQKTVLDVAPGSGLHEIADGRCHESLVEGS